MLDDLIEQKDRIEEKKDAIIKVIKWRGKSAPKQIQKTPKIG